MTTRILISALLISALPVAFAADMARIPVSDTSPVAPLLVASGQQINRLAGRGVALADFNEDGHLDAFVVNENGPDGEGFRVYFGDGQGGMVESAQPLPNPLNWTTRPALGDVDGDGHVDVVTGTILWRNDGHGRFTADSAWLEGDRLNELTTLWLAHLDGDKRLDAVAVNRWQSVRVFLSDRPGHGRDTGQMFGSGMIGGAALADVDGNGTTDLVTTGWRMKSTDACPNRVWLNDGHGHFRDGEQVFDLDGHHVHGAMLTDLNGDGAPDLVLGLTTPGNAGRVFLNDGRGRFRDTGQNLGHTWVHSVSSGDFDGDGTPDLFLVCGDTAGGTPNEVWLNDGRGTFRDSGMRLGNACSWDGAAGDLNEDGRADAFVVNLRVIDASKPPPVFGGVPAEIWLSQGADASASRARPIATGTGAGDVALPELMGDYLGQPLPGSEPVVFASGIISLADTNEHSAPSFSADGSEVLWFSNRWPDAGPPLTRTMRRQHGRWSAPAPSPFGLMPVFSPDGRRVYFFAPIPGPAPATDAQPTFDLWFAERAGADWTEPQCLNLVARYPELRSATMPRIARNETLYFTAYLPGVKSNHGIYRAELVGGKYAKPEPLPGKINLPPFLNWAPFIAPDKSLLLFSSNRTGARDKYGDIYVSRRLPDGSWADPVNLGEPVNTSQQEVFPGLSPDGKLLFFARDTPDRKNDIYWVDAASVPALRAAATSE
jgi:hypothetical protein